MIVVSNTSPIINLAAVGQLGLLRQLYARVIIPQAVYHETVVVGAGQPGAIEVTTFDWIEIRRATNEVAVASLQLELHEGEAEAIALAIELSADLLLLAACRRTPRSIGPCARRPRGAKLPLRQAARFRFAVRSIVTQARQKG